METELFNDIQKGVIDKRTRLQEWRQSTSEEDKQVMLTSENETGLQEHLHVIDVSLDKLQDGTLGVCTVCGGMVDPELLKMDYTSCICIDHYSDEERRQLESELELSQIVQRAMLPQTIPSIPGLDLAAFSRPAQIVSGDYFDFLRFKDDAYGFVVADVSGHGVSSGMLMTSLQTAFHTLVPEAFSPAEVLERINRLYIHNIKFDTFVTVFFGRLDPQTGRLTYANAGHNPALLYRRKENKIRRLERTGAAIGLIEGFVPRAETIELSKGDRLLLYTDGVTEALNPRHQPFGEERLADVFMKNRDLPAKELIRVVREALNDFTQGQALADDITMVVCGIV